jgi:hypothetical protein
VLGMLRWGGKMRLHMLDQVPTDSNSRQQPDSAVPARFLEVLKRNFVDFSHLFRDFI